MHVSKPQALGSERIHRNKAALGPGHQLKERLEMGTVLGCICQLISIHPKCSPALSQSGFCAEEMPLSNELTA